MEPVKLPVEVVVMVVGVVAIPALSYDIVIPEFGAKLLPVTVTLVPVGPLVGLSDIVATGAGGTVTVNDADAELNEASVALTVCVPAPEEDGTVMEPVKLPAELAVTVVGVVVIPEPSYDMVTAEFATKLLPEMFTVVPVGPLDGLSDMDGVVTVNGVEAELDDASVALTV